MNPFAENGTGSVVRLKRVELAIEWICLVGIPMAETPAEFGLVVSQNHYSKLTGELIRRTEVLGALVALWRISGTWPVGN